LENEVEERDKEIENLERQLEAYQTGNLLEV